MLLLRRRTRALLLGALWIGAALAHAQETDADHEATIWMEPLSRPKAVAMVVHGLNLRPCRMNAIARELTGRGVLVLRVTLTGHDGDTAAFSRVTRDDWLRDLNQAYQQVAERGRHFDCPVLFVGFSLGAVAGLDLMTARAGIRFDGIVLFAPAITPRWYTYSLVIGNLAGKDVIFPSATPKSYRVNSGTPVAAYNALFDHVRHVRRADIEHLDVPVLVFIDPEDELVSYDGLKHFVRERGLDGWRVIEVDHSETLLGSDSYHHLVVDAVSVGTRQWRIMGETMQEYLELTQRAPGS